MTKQFEHNQEKSALQSSLESIAEPIFGHAAPEWLEAPTLIKEAVKTAPLFVRGKVGLASTVALYALDEVKIGKDGQAHMTQDTVLGATKGILTKAVFSKVSGINEGLALIPKQLALAKNATKIGFANRFISSTLTRSNWTDEQSGKVSIAKGLQTTTENTLNPMALGADVLGFGAGLAAEKSFMLSKIGKKVITSSPLAAMAVTNFGQGVSMGAYSEVGRQNASGEKFDLSKIGIKGLVQGSLCSISSVPGGVQARIKAGEIKNQLDFHYQYKKMSALEAEKVNVQNAKSNRFNYRRQIEGLKLGTPSVEAVRELMVTAMQLKGDLSKRGFVRSDLLGARAHFVDPKKLNDPRLSYDLNLSKGNDTEYGVMLTGNENATMQVQTLKESSKGKEFDTWDDFVKNGVEYKSVPASQFFVRGLKTNMYVPKEDMKVLEMGEFTLTSTDAQGKKIEEAQPFNLNIFGKILHSLPSPDLINNLDLYAGLGPANNPDIKIADSRGLNLGYATSHGEIVLYALGSYQNKIGIIADTLRHEWSHLLDFKFNRSGNFSRSVDFEKALTKGWVPRDYARYCKREAFAVLGENLLHPSSQKFLEPLRPENAPWRSFNYMKVLEKCMRDKYRSMSADENSIENNPKTSFDILAEVSNQVNKARLEFSKKYLGPELVTSALHTIKSYRQSLSPKRFMTADKQEQMISDSLLFMGLNDLAVNEEIAMLFESNPHLLSDALNLYVNAEGINDPTIEHSKLEVTEIGDKDIVSLLEMLSNNHGELPVVSHKLGKVYQHLIEVYKILGDKTKPSDFADGFAENKSQRSLKEILQKYIYYQLKGDGDNFLRYHNTPGLLKQCFSPVWLRKEAKGLAERFCDDFNSSADISADQKKVSVYLNQLEELIGAHKNYPELGLINTGLANKILKDLPCFSVQSIESLFGRKLERDEIYNYPEFGVLFKISQLKGMLLELTGDKFSQFNYLRKFYKNMKDLDLNEADYGGDVKDVKERLYELTRH